VPGEAINRRIRQQGRRPEVALLNTRSDGPTHWRFWSPMFDVARGQPTRPEPACHLRPATSSLKTHARRLS